MSIWMCVRWWWWARIDKAKKKKKTSFFTSSFFSYPVTRKKNDVRRNILLLLLFVFIIHIQYSISLRLSFYMLVFFRHAHTSKCNIGVIIEHVRQRRRRREGRDARAPIAHMMRLCTRRFLKNERRRRRREGRTRWRRKTKAEDMYVHTIIAYFIPWSSNHHLLFSPFRRVFKRSYMLYQMQHFFF